MKKLTGIIYILFLVILFSGCESTLTPENEENPNLIFETSFDSGSFPTDDLRIWRIKDNLHGDYEYVPDILEDSGEMVLKLKSDVRSEGEEYNRTGMAYPLGDSNIDASKSYEIIYRFKLQEAKNGQMDLSFRFYSDKSDHRTFIRTQFEDGQSASTQINVHKPDQEHYWPYTTEEHQQLNDDFYMEEQKWYTFRSVCTPEKFIIYLDDKEIFEYADTFDQNLHDYSRVWWEVGNGLTIYIDHIKIAYLPD